MPGKSYILAIDQGTTGSTALLFDEEAQVVAQLAAAAANHTVGQRHGGGHPGGILVNIERPIEMRDAEALQ